MERPNDPVEAVIFDGLISAGIEFTMPDPPDFYIPIINLSIECKQFYTPRTDRYLMCHPNTVVIQGMEAAMSFSELLKWSVGPE